MKKKLFIGAGAAVLLIFVVGTVFAFLRPEYTSEAVGILFRNELELHPEDLMGEEPEDNKQKPAPEVGQSPYPTPGKTAPRMQEQESSSEQPEE